MIVTSQVGRAPVAGGDSQPRLARDDRSLAGREAAIAAADPGAAGDLALVVEAFDRVSGRRVWVHRAPAVGPFPELHEKHNLATPTPVADGERVYAWFGNGQLVALDLATGRPTWSRHLGTEYAPFDAQWGHGSSPARYRDLVILLCDHRTSSYLLALDAKTGRERWKVARGSGLVSHSTPVVIPGPRGDELLVNSSARIDAYDPATGAALWFAGSQRQTPIPSAVFHDGRIFLSRGYRNSDVLAIRPGGRGDVSATHVDWTAPNGASYVPSIVHYDGLLYMTNEVGIVTDDRRVDGREGVAAPAGRRVLRVARGRRRQGLLRQRDGGDVRAEGRADRGGPGDERSRRALPGVTGHRRRPDLPAIGPHAVRGRPIEPVTRP